MSAKTVMVFESLEHIMIDVLPGVPLPAPVADFIFSRVEWIRQGERGVFERIYFWECQNGVFLLVGGGQK